MKVRFIILGLLILMAASISAQETYFGKNKVRYKEFEWNFISSRHFDVYFYDNAYPTAKFTVTVMESAYVEISNELNYVIQKRIPVFVYNSHNDFQQTNIISSMIPEGVGGFTEAFKNRIVIPFDGSYEDFRHVLHHELTHAVIYDMLYGNMFSSLLSRRRLFNLPLWYAEGFAEYSSRHGWDYFSDMFVRDATINGYLTPPMYLGGFLAYKQGQAMVKYIADKYGEDKLGEILKKGRVFLTMNKALEETIGITEEKLWEEFSKEMRRRYWPEIARRDEPEEIGNQLTKARKDGSYFNEEPTFHPHGDKLAIFTDRSDYTEIILIETKKGEKIKSLIKGERSGDLESLHSFVSGMSFSPDGNSMVFVAKSNGDPTLMLYDLADDKIYKKKKFEFQNIVSPAWSPLGDKIAFSALKGHKRDIYVYHLESELLEQVTDDRYDDKDPSWLPDGQELVFSSDRPHPTSVMPAGDSNIYVSAGAYLPGDFDYGYYNLFEVDLGNYQVIPLMFGPGQNYTPAVSPDGKKVAFISNRNGIDNIYVGYLDSVKFYPVTNILTGVRSLSWAPDGKKIAFSAFNKGGFDIFLLKDIAPVGENGSLEITDYIAGNYDLLNVGGEQEKPALARQEEQPDTTASITDTTEVAVDSLPASDSTTVADLPEEEEDPYEDSVITETGIYDEGFVFVSEEETTSLDSLLIDVPDDSVSNNVKMEEPAAFDSIPGPDKEGNYEVHPYKVKFTPDFVGGGVSYDTFFGLSGVSYFVFTDYLGNHQFYLVTDLVNTIDQSNVQLYYFYNKKRTNLGLGLFHTKNYYIDTYDYLFSDRFYGFQGFARYPFSTFKRLDFTLSQYFIDREYLDFDDTRENRSSQVTTADLSYVLDNIVWGLTGPINGRRAKFSASTAVNLFDSKDIEYYAFEFDYRKYWHIKNTFSFAFRLSGGASFGKTPKQYFLGGTTNWIGNRTLDAKVYEVENLYFADVITPLRGVPYYELSGNRYGLINAEFRFPLIDYFIMRFPLPIALSRVQGVIFTDIGSAWFDDQFKGGVSTGSTNYLRDIKVGFGTGMRLNLGFFLLRYDVAWSTDLNSVSDRASHYFSFGADF